MIISASRRTDIPSFYSEWFLNRLKEGYVLIQNPRNQNRYSRAILTPDAVDCIVFWTKNPEPMLSKLDDLTMMGYPFYFQFTLTPYGKNIELGLPDKMELIHTFCTLSDIIGPFRTVWRYDPVIICEEFTVDEHLKAFEKMAKLLGNYTNRCIISFINLYSYIYKRTKNHINYVMNEDNIRSIAKGFSYIASHYGIKLYTCAEEIELSEYGVKHGSCIDKEMVEKILGCSIEVKKDKNQRTTCKCVESIDIGTYDCCLNGCIYCYANTSRQSVLRNMKMHNPHSPVLIGQINPNAIITERESHSIKCNQTSIFDLDYI